MGALSLDFIAMLGGFPSGSVVKSLFANAGGIRDTGSIPGLEDPLEDIAAQSHILAWRIPWSKEPG